MLQLPTAPTDSLYKFLAIGGLSLAALSATYPQTKQIELQVAAASVTAEREKITVALNTVERELQALEKKKELTSEEINLVREKHEENKLRIVEAKHAEAVLTIQERWLAYYINLSRVGLLLGFVLSVVGTVLWYVRVQRPSDIALENSATRAP